MKKAFLFVLFAVSTAAVQAEVIVEEHHPEVVVEEHHPAVVIEPHHTDVVIDPYHHHHVDVVEVG